MHGASLCVTKILMNTFFPSTNAGKEYFVSRHLKNISSRLQSICPPDCIERMPSDLEKHYSNFKATELQSWLLFYAVPCLHEFLSDVYLEHLACLCEGIHLLLGDKITECQLGRTEALLDSFYKDFADLYGKGSCGFNVHNIGAHLSFLCSNVWSSLGVELFCIRGLECCIVQVSAWNWGCDYAMLAIDRDRVEIE